MDKFTEQHGAKVVKLKLKNIDELMQAKLPPQMKGIVKCLHANKGMLTQADLVEKLPKHLATVQTPKRIFMFYRKRMIEDGLIEVA